ncbi:MAG: hypothetical protein ACC633_04985 [Anaerolineales bacterium]
MLKNECQIKYKMIKLGVSGHRFLNEEQELSRGIDEALNTIAQTFGDQPFRVISGLAEGADRLIVRRVLKRKGSRLTVLLPLPEDEYLKDFDGETSQKEFQSLLGQADQIIQLPIAPSREGAYARQGSCLLNQSDILLIIWDGLDSQGLGGTGDVAAAARAQNMPLAWVKAGNRKPGTTEHTSLSIDQGSVVYENFPETPGS